MPMFRLMCAFCTVCAVAQDIPSDPALRKSPNTYHPVTDVLRGKRGTVTDDQLEKLKTLPFEAIWGAVQQAGYTNSFLSGMQTTRPNERLVGRAVTIRYLPKRPDLVEAMETLSKEGDWPAGFHVRAGERARPGDVMVVDLGGAIGEGVFTGDVSALAMKTNGARGIVAYGSTRDFTELREFEGFPVIAMGFDPRPALQIGVDWNVPIRVGNATVLPGDVVVADAEAVLFFPAHLAAKVIESATETQHKENFERDRVREKKYRFRDIYPLNPELKKRYEEERKKK